MSFRIALIIFSSCRMVNGKLKCIYISLSTPKSAYQHLAHSRFTHGDRHLRCHLLIRTGNRSHIHSHNGNAFGFQFFTQGYFETVTGQGSKILQSVDNLASGLTNSQPPRSTGKILLYGDWANLKIKARRHIQL